MFSQYIVETDKFCFACRYDQNDIEVYFDEEQIRVEYLKEEKDIIRIKENFSYLAYHEYGHSLFSTSSENLRKYWESQLDFRNLFQYYNWFALSNCFLEFFADFKAKRISCDAPIFFIQDNFDWIEESKLEGYELFFPSNRINELDPSETENWLTPTLNNLRTFYIWDEWEQLIPIFEDLGLSAILKFLRILFECFYYLCESHTDLIATREKLIDLIRVLDNNKFDDLIFNKNLNDEIKNLFDSFLK